MKERWKRLFARFERCCDGPEYNKAGADQFIAYESMGTLPENPDPYFQRLLDGKKWYEWTINEYAALYDTSEWWGWDIIKRDLVDDPSMLEDIRRRVGTRKGHLLCGG